MPTGALDAWLAVVLAVAQVLILRGYWITATRRAAGRPGAGGAVALLTALPLAARRRAPFVVFAIIAAGTFAHAMLPLLTQGVLAGPPLGSLVALYSVAAHDSSARSWIAAVIGVGWIGVLYVVTEAADFVPFFSAVLVACWVSGRLARTRALYVAELERDREARARLAVAHERARIARELHDVIAHAASVIHVQARAARGALHTDVSAADAALEAVERTAGQALGEMRLLLGAPARRRSADPFAAAAHHRSCGTRRPVSPGGPAGPHRPSRQSPAGVGCCRRPAYRIVQESLTNVLEHAHPSEVVVRVGHDDAQLHVEVVNDGAAGITPRSAGSGGGLGLAGMHERVRLLGGRLIAGPAPAGGFRVLATLPVEQRRPVVREGS